MTDSSKVSALLSQKNPWEGNKNPVWLCSTLSLLRNLEKFSFPLTLDDEQRKQIMGLIGKTLVDSKGLVDPLLIKVEDCSSRDKELLFERFLSTHPYVHAQSGQAFLIDKTGQLLGVLNMEDHLELTILNFGDDFERSFECLVKLEMDLGKHLHYAFSPTFGFLTANPAHAGTGLIVRVFLQIPAILQTGRLSEVMARHKSDYIRLESLTGDSEDYVGNVIVVRNAFTLGLSEEKILAEIRNFATHLFVEEKSLWSKLQSHSNPEIKDRVSRAYGLIEHSYQLDTFEALNALSLVKLGLQLGWVKGIESFKLNELFFNCRRAHLIGIVDQGATQDDIAHHRALYLRKHLNPMELKI